jgi:transcriptional regulator with XRE-family HTH domain
MKDNQGIILRIRELMENLALNQTEFSKECRIEQANLSAILNGKRPIGSAVINKIVLAFDINRNWLVTGDGERFRSNMIRDTQAAYSQKTANEINAYESVKILSQSNMELLEMYKQSVQEIRALEDRLSDLLGQTDTIKNE